MKRWPIRMPDCWVIALTRDRFTAVDLDVGADVLSHVWGCNEHGYASRNTTTDCGARTRVLMHRVLMGHPAGLQVDHIDGDRLNNRLSNLRPATNRQNHSNIPGRGKSRHRGVCWDSNRQRWYAEVRRRGPGGKTERIRLGRFVCEDAAGMAWNKAALASGWFDPTFLRLNQVGDAPMRRHRDEKAGGWR